MSRPIVDYKGRRRSKTIAFRVSPEEDEVINALVAASGMTKQDYITSRLECRDINVSPNVRVYRMLRDQIFRRPFRLVPPSIISLARARRVAARGGQNVARAEEHKAQQRKRRGCNRAGADARRGDDHASHRCADSDADVAERDE